MARQNVINETALDEHPHSFTVGAKARKLFEEMQANIHQLQEMHSYAVKQGYNETAKNLNKVLEAFKGLQRKYGSAEILNEIKQAANNPHIKAVRLALKEAKEDMQAHGAERELFIRWLMTTPYQQAYENVNKFGAPQRNKFEIFIDALEQFEQTHKKDAKNASRFFHEAKTAAPQEDVKAKFERKLK